jgi:hypothetical protein
MAESIKSFDADNDWVAYSSITSARPHDANG